MVNKIIYMFHISCSFTIVVCEKNIMPNLTNSQEPELHVFGPLGAGAIWKKIPGAGATCEKNQKPEPLGKKSGTGAPQSWKLWFNYMDFTALHWSKFSQMENEHDSVRMASYQKKYSNLCSARKTAAPIFDSYWYTVFHI